MSQTSSNTNYTLSYDDGVKGWTSFFSYFPDWMIGMNNYFYTFNRGNLYRHNVNEVRNQYYGVNYPSTLTSVFNDMPTENKLFKTIKLDGSDSWKTELYSDVQTTGFINKEYYELKEGSWFAFVRNDGTTPADSVQEYPLRSLNGLGSTTSFTVSGSVVTLNFALTSSIGNIISIGDTIYYGVASGTPPSVVPQIMGDITAVNQNLPAGINQVVVNLTGTAPTNQSTYILYLKNAVAESHGILGHYGVFHIENNNTEKVELFVVESEVMKSFP